MPRKKTLRLPPCPPYDLEGTESWLEELAARGLHLTPAGFFAGAAVFEKGEPRALRYRLDAAPRQAGLMDDNGGDPDPVERELRKAAGWDYVARRGQFYIYRAEGDEAAELHTDPAVQALRLQALVRRQRSAALSVLVWLLLYPVIFLRGRLLLTALELGTPLFLLVCAAALLLLVASVRTFLSLNALRRRLKNGEPPDHGKDWRSGAARWYLTHFALAALVCFLAVVLLVRWNDAAREERRPLSDWAGPLPFASLGELEPESAFSEKDWLGTDGYSLRADLLAPVNIRWTEHGEFGPPASGSGGFYVEYHEAASSWLASRLTEELLRTDRLMAALPLFWKRTGLTALPLPSGAERFDFAAAYRDRTHFPTLLLQKGCRVLHVTFYRNGETADEAAWLDRIADAFWEA